MYCLSLSSSSSLLFQAPLCRRERDTATLEVCGILLGVLVWLLLEGSRQPHDFTTHENITLHIKATLSLGIASFWQKLPPPSFARDCLVLQFYLFKMFEGKIAPDASVLGCQTNNE